MDAQIFLILNASKSSCHYLLLSGFLPYFLPIKSISGYCLPSRAHVIWMPTLSFLKILLPSLVTKHNSFSALLHPASGPPSPPGKPLLLGPPHSLARSGQGSFLHPLPSLQSGEGGEHVCPQDGHCFPGNVLLPPCSATSRGSRLPTPHI